MSIERNTHPAKVLTFFNHRKIVAELTTYLEAIKQEYAKVYGGLDSCILKGEAVIDSDHQPRKEIHPTGPSQKKFVVLDPNITIQGLRTKIALYEARIAAAKQTPKTASELVYDERNIPSFSGAKKIPDDNIKYTAMTKISVIGAIPDRDGQTISNMLDMNRNIEPEKDLGFLIGIDFKVSMLTETHKLQIWFNAYQERFDSIFYAYLISAHVLLIFFDLNNDGSAERSYYTANRLALRLQPQGKLIVMMGLHKPNKINYDGLRYFNRFQKEQAVNHFLVCEETPKGKEILREFLTSRIILPRYTVDDFTPFDDSSYIYKIRIKLKNNKLLSALYLIDEALSKNLPIPHGEEKIILPQKTSVLIFVRPDFLVFYFYKILKDFNIETSDSSPKMFSNDFFKYRKKFTSPLNHPHFLYSDSVLVDYILTQDSDEILKVFQNTFSSVPQFYSENEPLLHIAVRFGLQHVVEWLISEGSDVNQLSEDGRTTLMIAIIYDHKNLIPYLISKGYDTTIELNPTSSCLSLAARTQPVDILKLLIECYKDHETLTSYINEAMIQAIIFDQLDNFQFLLSNGGNIKYQDNQGRSLLFVATHCSYQCAQFLFSTYPELKFAEGKFSFAFEAAIFSKNEIMMSLLIEQGADLNSPLPNRMLPLTFALSTFNLDCVKYLAEHKADIALISNDLPNFIETALNNTRPIYELMSFLKYLVKVCQIKIDAQNMKGQTALTVSVRYAYNHDTRYSDYDVTRYLVEAGADLMIRDKQGISAVYFALMKHKMDMALLIFTKATNRAKSDPEFSSELFNVIDNEFFEIVRRLGNHSEDIQFEGNHEHFISLKQVGKRCLKLLKSSTFSSYTSKALLRACEEGELDIVKSLLNIYQFDINEEASSDKTPLLCASQHLSLVEYLIEQGAKINQCTMNGWTALTWAADQGHIDTMTFLLSRHALLQNIDQIMFTGDGLKNLQEAWVYTNTDADVLEEDHPTEDPTRQNKCALM